MCIRDRSHCTNICLERQQNRPVNFDHACKSAGPPKLPFHSPSPPGASPGNPSVVGVLEPAEWWEEVEGSEHSPAASELPQRPADRRRAFELLSIRLDHPRGSIHLGGGEAHSLGQPRLLVRPRIDLGRPIVALDPAREPNSKVALAVVYQDQPIIRHGPKLHCL